MDIKGEAKVQRLPIQPNSNQATSKTRSGEGRFCVVEESLGAGVNNEVMDLCMIGLTILWR